MPRGHIKLIFSIKIPDPFYSLNFKKGNIYLDYLKLEIGRTQEIHLVADQSIFVILLDV